MNDNTTKEVFRKDIPKLNPFVETPRMRVDAINYLNELIDRDKEMAIGEKKNEGTDHSWYECPVCEALIADKTTNFCRRCGQRLDITNIAF